MNMQSMRDVPKQLKIIYDRSLVNDQIVAVIANKIELLDDISSELSVTGDSIKEQSTISIQEEALATLEKTIAKDFPQVSMHEMSIKYNIGVK